VAEPSANFALMISFTVPPLGCLRTNFLLLSPTTSKSFKIGESCFSLFSILTSFMEASGTSSSTTNFAKSGKLAAVSGNLLIFSMDSVVVFP